MDTNNGEWKVKQSYFQGWTKAEIEGIKDSLRKNDDAHRELLIGIKELNKFDKQMALKFTGFGGAIGALVSVLLRVLLGI